MVMAILGSERTFFKCTVQSDSNYSFVVADKQSTDMLLVFRDSDHFHF